MKGPKKRPMLKDRPFPEDMDRGSLAGERRGRASLYSRGYAEQRTSTNEDECNYADEGYPVSFTKGLPHDEFGLLEDDTNYEQFVKEINQQDATDFETVPRGIDTRDGANPSREALTQRMPAEGEGQGSGKRIAWRGWESPRAGHYYDLQGPDADAVGMPPAPDFGTEELVAEMGEVYAMAMLRDVAFSDITAGTGSDGKTGITSAEVLDALAKLSWFASVEDENLSPEEAERQRSAFSLQQLRRRAARRIDHGKDFAVDEPPNGVPFDKKHAFRGSGPAAKAGPYVSQFMLYGTNRKTDPADDTKTVESKIAFGTQLIDQKTRTFAEHQDYMLHWNAAVDVQNGADFTDDNELLENSRFISAPRDLAAYVRYDALYQAYLNGCLILLGARDESGNGIFGTQQPLPHPHSEKPGPGFPDRSKSDPRQAFATFGGPHVLSLVTEVATRCLKAVRRQKFNYHRRARPERIGELLALQSILGDGNDGAVPNPLKKKTQLALKNMMGTETLGPLLDLVRRHNASRVSDGAADPHLDFENVDDASWFKADENVLLPMAFAEGSPMHPSYGAGHATVAGGCVTMLKAFFHTVEEGGKKGVKPVPWPEKMPVLEASRGGSALVDVKPHGVMTISGELNKLAANISIARNMAGVHYYTDYYESLRMGERVATGILIEQMKQYNEPVEMDFESFDGDHVHILKVDHDYADPRIFIHDAQGSEVSLDEWWNRHLVSSDLPGNEGPPPPPPPPVFASNSAQASDAPAMPAQGSAPKASAATADATRGGKRTSAKRSKA